MQQQPMIPDHGTTYDKNPSSHHGGMCEYRQTDRQMDRQTDQPVPIQLGIVNMNTLEIFRFVRGAGCSVASLIIIMSVTYCRLTSLTSCVAFPPAEADSDWPLRSKHNA